jgi:hypothetical protein
MSGRRSRDKGARIERKIVQVAGNYLIRKLRPQLKTNQASRATFWNFVSKIDEFYSEKTPKGFRS